MSLVSKSFPAFSREATLDWYRERAEQGLLSDEERQWQAHIAEDLTEEEHLVSWLLWYRAHDQTC